MHTEYSGERGTEFYDIELLLHENSTESTGGIQKKHLLISECKIEEILNCRIKRNSLWNVLVLNCRFSFGFITVSGCFLSMHSVSVCLSFLFFVI